MNRPKKFWQFKKNMPLFKVFKNTRFFSISKLQLFLNVILWFLLKF